MRSPLRVIALTNEDPQYGQHSGYFSQAFSFASSDGIRLRTIVPRLGWWPRALGKVLSLGLGTPPRNQAEQVAEVEFLAHTWLDPKAIAHVALIEDHFPLVRRLRRDRLSWVATVHFPAPHWREEDVTVLRRFGKIIVLCRRDAEVFSKWLPEERIVFIPHGVDTAFFHHDSMARSTIPRVIFVGKWLRDLETAGEVLFAALARWPELGVDIVIARKWAVGSQLAALASHPRVRWHEAITDDALRRLYQSAWLLLMPLHETSANNALVEALACGTVPIVNNVGGVIDYGGGHAFPMSETNQSASYLALMEEYFSNTRLLAERSSACRQFALERLDWQLIRGQQKQIYEELFEAGSAE